MIDTKTLTCSNCHGGDFIRLDDNEFKCSHCGSITIVQDDVAQRLEKLLRTLQAPTPAATSAPRATQVLAVRVVVCSVLASLALVLLANVFLSVGRTHRTATTAGYRSRSDVDPGLLKIQDLHRTATGDKLVGLVRNDSDRVVSHLTLAVNMYTGSLRGEQRSAWMSMRLLPGESLPIIFEPWSQQAGERFEVADKEVRTDDDFDGRANLHLARQQLIREGTRLRFIGQLTDADTAAAKSINVSINLLDAKGRLIGFGHGSPDSSELARGEATRFDVSIDRYSEADIASMQYLVDSERASPEARP